MSKETVLYITPEAMKRVMYYTKAADGEVSGLGTVVQDKNKDWIVEKVYLLEQESSGAGTELNPEAISKLMHDILEKNEDPGKIKFWWHSHSNMGVFWSGTDDECVETLSKEFAFSLVINKSGEKKCRVDIYHPFRFTKDNIRIEELRDEDETLKKECEEEVKQKVKSFSERWTYNGGYYGHRSGLNSYCGNRPEIENKTRTDIKEAIADDITRLMTICQQNEELGGIFAPETWTEFIQETIKTAVQERYEKKSSCSNFGTYARNYEVCHKCKTKKECAFWTKEWEKDSVITVI